MTDSLSRRNWIKTVGVAGAGALVSRDGIDASLGPFTPSNQMQSPILPLTSTSEVFVPPRGRAFQKFSFDFPEPSVAFGNLRFGFMVYTGENAYGMDASQIVIESVAPERLRVRCSRFVWAGGQQTAPGRLEVEIRGVEGSIEWDGRVEMAQPIKAVTTIVRGVPRGRISSAGGNFFDPNDNEILLAYPFSGGDLFGPGASGGLVTPLVIIEPSDGGVFYLSSRDDRVRTKRFFLQPGENAYRVELAFETEGWTKVNQVAIPTWRVGRAGTLAEAIDPHYEHLARAYRLQPWETRPDAPEWLRNTALAVTLHGMHYTGYIFNDYARMLEIARWIATQIPPDRVLVFISSWDGRYYWDYPNYEAPARMGDEAGFRRLIHEGQQLGLHMMPMFGANAANRRQPAFERIADAATQKIDGDVMEIDWVDWDNDRHQEGWLSYMNLGVPSWREWLFNRIADVIERYEPDAYFLDIIGGWINNPQGDMHEGARRLITDLRTRYPNVVPVGEMHYDGLLSFIPMFHSFGQFAYPEATLKYARFFQHLSHPAPGRGSSGVHESGFGRFDPETLSLRDEQIPTLMVVDDTFAQHRDTMAAIIRRARERAGIG